MTVPDIPEVGAADVRLGFAGSGGSIAQCSHKRYHTDIMVGWGITAFRSRTNIVRSITRVHLLMPRVLLSRTGCSVVSGSFPS